MPGKYVVLQTPDGERVLIIPDDEFFHNDVVDLYHEHEVVSAGFVSIDKQGHVHCYGRSEGLNIAASRGTDDETLIQTSTQTIISFD